MEAKTNKGLFTSKRDDWETPQDIFDPLDREFHFVLDPCSTHKNAKCKHHFTKAEDGLRQDWLKYGSVFMNPPYGRKIGEWMSKANQTAAEGATVVCLVPARTDTNWWHRYCQDSRFADDQETDGVRRTVRLLKGRLKFDGKNPAPFPSAIVILQPLLLLDNGKIWTSTGEYGDWLIENKKKWLNQ